MSLHVHIHDNRSRDFGPSDTVKKGDKVRLNVVGSKTETVAEQRGTTVFFESGGHAHITKLVAA